MPSKHEHLHRDRNPHHRLRDLLLQLQRPPLSLDGLAVPQSSPLGLIQGNAQAVAPGQI
ncbi:MAG: hypothetical protein AAGF75_12130 [Cyanobacteria bacterium P01_H01_bin.130]